MKNRRQWFRSRSSRLVAALSLLSVASSASVAHAQRTRPEGRDLEMTVGEQTSISAQGVTSYSEGSPGIVDVRVPSDGTRFVIVALQAGTTTLLLIMDDGTQVQYRITIRSQNEEPTGIQPRDNIRLDFYFVQLDESYGHQIGIGWPTSIGGAGVFTLNATFDLTSTSFTNATAVVTQQPLPRIDLLESSGWARVARQAAVVTANNNEATFASGGELNVPVTSAVGSGSLEQVSFGSTVNVLPRYDRETGRIELRINAEVSDLTDDRGTGVPGRNISSVQTLVNLEMGQAVALGGLIADSESASQSGLPGLSQIPILGILFGTHAARRQYTQNVLFIVPTVVDVVSQQARARIAEALETYWDYSGGLDDIELLQQPETVPSGAHPDSRKP
jgi:pilus assembly protein CpaC